MARRLRGNARTTPEIRKAIQESPESHLTLARRYGINPKTVGKWKKRESTDDLPAGPKPARHRKMTAEEEEIIVRFREHTLLPLDDCLYALQARIPHLSRSSLHRCLQRHGISRLADTDEVRDNACALEAIPVGSLHIDIAAVESDEGTHYLFIAIDQASKFAFVQMAARGGSDEATGFLGALARVVPFRIHRVLTLNAKPFVSGDRLTAFARLCREQGIEHQLTKNPHPWARNRTARMGRMIQESVTHDNHVHFAGLLRDFVFAYNYRRRLKTLRGRTPYEFICLAWQKEPQRFLCDPRHELLGLETMSG